MTETLYVLAVLACPVGMGLMMWFMRGGKQDTGVASEQEAQMAHLRTEIEQLRAERPGASQPTEPPAPSSPGKA